MKGMKIVPNKMVAKFGRHPLLREVATRLLYAYVVSSDAGPLRVLQKSGLVVVLNESASRGPEKTREVGDDPTAP